jgi:hypothetical protein
VKIVVYTSCNQHIPQSFANTKGSSLKILCTLELSVKSSKESTETVSLLKSGNKVVEVG